jgi:transposase
VRYRRRCFAVCRTNCNASLGSIDRIEQRIGAWQKQEAACRAIAAVPGIGKLTATALVATIGDARTFKSGREFASFLGLVPRQSGTGGKIRLGSIPKRGDPYLRTLLIHGARSNVNLNTAVRSKARDRDEDVEASHQNQLGKPGGVHIRLCENSPLIEAPATTTS